MYQLEILYLDQFDYQRAKARSTDTKNLPPKYKYFKAIISIDKDMILMEILKHIGIRVKDLENYSFRQADQFREINSTIETSIIQNISTFLVDCSVFIICQENYVGNATNPVLQYLDHERLNTDIAQSTADILLLNVGSCPSLPMTEYQEKPDFVKQANAKGYEIAIFNIDPHYRGFYKENNKDYFKNRYMVSLEPYLFQSQKLLFILQEKMKKGIKVIICDNVGLNLTDFTYELSTRNLDQFQRNLAIMSHYFQVYYDRIALVFSSDYFKQMPIRDYAIYISKNMADKILIQKKPGELESYIAYKLQKDLLQQFGIYVYNKEKNIALHNHLDLKLQLSFAKLSRPSSSSSNPIESEVTTTEKANIRQRP